MTEPLPGPDELADRKHACDEELLARISQLEAEVVKQRIIAKNATDHWQQSARLASLRAGILSGRLELRKLNDAMTRKNRVIAKRAAERDQLQTRIDAATAELKKWDALATRESEWMPCRAGLAALQGTQPSSPLPVSGEQATEAKRVERPWNVDMRTASDCLRACLATITGRPYEDAPDNEGDWRGKAVAFLKASATPPRFVVGIGESPRGCKGGHAIVCHPDGTPVHDPHPSRACVVAMWELWDVDGQIAVDQAEFARREVERDAT